MVAYFLRKHTAGFLASGSNYAYTHEAEISPPEGASEAPESRLTGKRTAIRSILSRFCAGWLILLGRFRDSMLFLIPCIRFCGRWFALTIDCTVSRIRTLHTRIPLIYHGFSNLPYCGFHGSLIKLRIDGSLVEKGRSWSVPAGGTAQTAGFCRRSRRPVSNSGTDCTAGGIEAPEKSRESV